jgi:hypothetical protein
LGFTAPGDKTDWYMGFTFSMVYIILCELILHVIPLFYGEYELEAEADARSDDGCCGK